MFALLRDICNYYYLNIRKKNGIIKVIPYYRLNVAVSFVVAHNQGNSSISRSVHDRSTASPRQLIQQIPFLYVNKVNLMNNLCMFMLFVLIQN